MHKISRSLVITAYNDLSNAQKIKKFRSSLPNSISSSSSVSVPSTCCSHRQDHNLEDAGNGLAVTKCIDRVQKLVRASAQPPARFGISITGCERCHIQKISVRDVPIPHKEIHSKWSSMPILRNGQQRIPDIRPNSDFHQYGHLSSAGKPQHVRGLSIRQWLCQIRLPYMRAERWWVQQLSAKWSCLLQSSVLATQASA